MTRLDPEIRREQIVHAAKSMSYEGGLYKWTLEDVAKFVGITTPGVRYYFFSTAQLRDEIIRNAIDARDVPIVLQAIAAHDPIAESVGPALRKACARAVAA